MKKVIGFIMVIALAGLVAQADSYSVSLVCTGTATQTTGQLPIAGVLDKIEYVKTGLVTTTVTVATFDGTTAIETYMQVAVVGATRGFVRPRFIGQTYAGVALAYGLTGGSDSNETQVLVAQYEKPLIGGNVQATFANTVGQETLRSTNTITIFYTPYAR